MLVLVTHFANNIFVILAYKHERQAYHYILPQD